MSFWRGREQLSVSGVEEVESFDETDHPPHHGPGGCWRSRGEGGCTLEKAVPWTGGGSEGGGTGQRPDLPE